MTFDLVTVLRTVDGARMTKKITRHQDGSFEIEPYDRGFEFAVEQVPVTSIIELGSLLAKLELDPSACVIRGSPMPSINLGRCRRLKRARIDRGQQVAATFEPASPRWIGLDLDSLPTPEWDQEALARRRAAILADYAHRNTPDASGHSTPPRPHRLPR